MKKFLIITFAVLLVSGCTQKSIVQNSETTNQNYIPEIAQEEIDFNNSGKAKAIVDETDLWQFYKNKEAGFSLKYPHNVGAMTDSSIKDFHISIDVRPISGLEGNMGFNEETALKNIKSLKSGEYGYAVDFQFEESKKLIPISGVNAQQFMVLARFEVCHVTFERKLYFFNNDHQIVITLVGPKDSIISSNSKYFEIDESNCGQGLIWNFDKQKDFYQTLASGQGSGVVQEWFDTFDKIIETIQIFPKKTTKDTTAIQGRWTLIDDLDSIIEFSEDTKVDLYADIEMSKGFFVITTIEDGQYLIVTNNDVETFKYKIVELTDTKLTLNYLPRGNELKYQR